MAIMTDEQMRDMSSVLGTCYSRFKDAIGDVSSPGTALFEIQKMRRYASNLLPDEGIISGCDISDTAGHDKIVIASGTVRYDGENISYSSEELPIDRTFTHAFDSTDRYGVIVGFKRSDLAAVKDAVRTTISAGITSGVSTSITITNTSATSGFTLPFHATIGTEQIEIWAIGASGELLISPSYNGGYAAQDHSSGDVIFISRPLSATLYFGLPVSIAFQTGAASTFQYYPPVSEKETIIIGRALIDNPNTMSVARTPVVFAYENLIVPITQTAGSEMFTQAEAQMIIQSIDSTAAILSSPTGFGTPGDILSAMVSWTIQETGQSFESYWGDRPFKSSGNYLRGTSFSGISRLEFDDQFKTLYRDVYGQDLLTTMAIFRGDIYGGSLSYLSPPENITSTFSGHSVATDGNLSYGTWTYRVSAVGVDGESSPSTSISVEIPKSSGSFNSVTLSWEAVTGASYYHVYRFDESGTDSIEYRLTSDSEVTGVTYEDKGLAPLLGVRRGIKMPGKTTESPSILYVYVPPMEGTFNTFFAGESISSSFTDDDTVTRNEVTVTVYGVKADGTIGGPHIVNIPQGTIRSTKFVIGDAVSDLYVGVHDVTVSVGADVELVGGRAAWSPYDMFVIQNI